MADKTDNLREKYLDAEALFRKYIDDGETRTIKGLTEWARVQGMKSSNGDQPTEMGVWKAIWRWASTHKELAWELMKDQTFGYSKSRFKYTRETWEQDMIQVKIRSAWQHATQAKKNKFLRQHGWISNGSS